jgi:hypothetical protein
MPEVLDTSSLPVEKLMKNFARSLKTSKTLYCTHQGVVTDTLELPDHETRLRTLIELVKLHGRFPKSKPRK